MTESEWNNCTDPVPMLGLLREKASDHRLRRFICACCRRVPADRGVRRQELRQDMAKDEMTLLRLVEEDDFSAVRCYHASVPQVVQSHEEWYFRYEV